MIPAAPNPLLMCGDVDPLDEYKKIDRALRFNAVDSPSLSRNYGASTDSTKFTLNTNLKLSKLGTIRVIIGAWLNGSNYSELRLHSDDTIWYVAAIGGTPYIAKSNRVFRDVGAHMNLNLACDTNHATLANRCAIEIDGELLTFSSNTIPQSASVQFNKAILHTIGALNAGAFLDVAALSDFHWVDGQILSSAAFGLKHPRTNQFRPKPYTGTFGNTGYHLDFSDGSAATSAALGKDRSGNNNDFTPANISVAAGAGCDWLPDTPTNNFCTWNPLAAVAVNGGSGVGAFTITDGGLVCADANSSNTVGTVTGTHLLENGVWCWEVTATVVGGSFGGVGIKKSGTDYTLYGLGAGDYAYLTSGQKCSSGGSTAFGPALVASDTVGFMLDIPAGTLSVWVNNIAQGVMYSGLVGPFLIARGDQQNQTANTFTLNSGQRAFVTTFPAAAKSICTKNFPVAQKVMKAESAFVARVDTGANITAALDSAAPWPAWIRAYKLRGASEGWRWVFSDDPTNYLDTSSTAAKAALPALSGASYSGLAFKVAAANGITTGTFVHVNGVADVINDGHSTTRKMIVLHRESTGGGDYPTYHPECTAGKLLYLNNTTAETTDASISTVTAGGFTAAAALPSGTYRWISFAEVDGFLKLGKYTPNASTDGPFSNNGLRSAFNLNRPLASANWKIHDAARDKYNVAGLELYPNLPNQESANMANLDRVSGGIKIRNAANNINNAGVCVTMDIAEFPFRYANAK